MVVFATPGMLHAGLSLQIFKKWAPNENNMVSFCYDVVADCIFPGFMNIPLPAIGHNARILCFGNRWLQNIEWT